MPPPSHQHRVSRIEWEHVVPASLMPARNFQCWENGSRSDCERDSAEARNMIFDLHNLVPSIGQVNALRGNKRYGKNEVEERDFGACTVEIEPDMFEPADEQRGDVAGVWLYMNWKHGVVIPEDELRMFIRWNRDDPVSAWEILRDDRIRAIQGDGNPWVR